VSGARLDAWEGQPAAVLARAWGAREVHLYAAVDSTNRVARRRAAAGAPAGTVILAEEQTAGRGRAGRSWASPPGLGLWCTVIARPGTGDALPLLPLLAGLDAARALEPELAGTIDIKWPNDLLIGGRKLGGVLCEGSWESGRPGAVAVGVGINILHASDDFPEALRESATSLRMAARGPVSRRVVADRLIRALVARCTGALQMAPEELASLRARDPLLGLPLEVTDPVTGVRTLAGIGAGVAGDGALLLRERGGTTIAIRSGTVRVAQAAEVGG
jgi:BirA family transcriptional regulator, biotin operon repressor / biotin---[acetyl-CoA-carboxylase] ligase